MNLVAEILKENSKANVSRLADWVGEDKERMSELMHLFLHGEYRVVQRTGHIISHISDKHPAVLQPHLEVMVKYMNQPGQQVAVKRNVVRVMQFLDLPEELHGDVMNGCFDLLADPKETIAVRAFSMTVLSRLAKFYPDIKQ